MSGSFHRGRVGIANMVNSRRISHRRGDRNRAGGRFWADFGRYFRNSLFTAQHCTRPTIRAGQQEDASMAAFIPRFAKDRIWPDRAADLRRDHWRNNGDRAPTGHGFHQHRHDPEVTKYAAPRRRAAEAPVHRRLAKAFAIARYLAVFVFAAGIALAGLIAAIITPPI